VGGDADVFVIAEIGLNHNGSLAAALALVDAAAEAGAAAVKLQTLRADGLVAAHCPPPAHVDVSSLRDFFRAFELDEAAHAEIARAARARGLAFLSTPFDLDAVDLLERVGVDAFKIASGDLTHRALIERVARTGRPLVMSTGMSTLDEVGVALAWARAAGATQVAVLHCVSAYPTPPGSENLRAVTTLAVACGVPAGLSDHSPSADALSVLPALGGSIYERHLVEADGSDAIDRAVSSTPAELRAAIEAARRTRRALGDGAKTCLPAEEGNRHGSRRGLYTARALCRGQVLTDRDVVALRPADGIAASDVHAVIGVAVARDLATGQAITWDDLQAVRYEVPRAV
jgi:N-acetylneuraminate synthase/N,N'-diacetyllegionaminate synthase